MRPAGRTRRPPRASAGAARPRRAPGQQRPGPGRPRPGPRAGPEPGGRPAAGTGSSSPDRAPFRGTGSAASVSLWRTMPGERACGEQPGPASLDSRGSGPRRTLGAAAPPGADFARPQTTTAPMFPGAPSRSWARLLGPDRKRSGRILAQASGRPAPAGREELKTTGDRSRPALIQGRADGSASPHRRTLHGSCHHAPAPRERRPLRAPDPSLEPEDEALHHDRAQRHLHHRPAAVAGLHRPVLRLHQGDRRQGRHDHVRRHQEAGPGGDRRAGDARRDALRQPALARRHAHQLPDRAPADQPPQGARRGRLRRRRRQQAARRRSCSRCAASATSSTSRSVASAR